MILRSEYNLNINKLRYFKAVCDYGGINKAAFELCVSQPSVTVAIKELENSLGVTLFHRIKKRLFLTEEGEVVLEKTNKLFNQLDTFFLEVTDVGSVTKKSVRLGVPPIIGTLLIPKIHMAFTKQFPDMSIEIVECTLNNALDFLNDNELDICLLMGEDIPANFDKKPFFETEIQFCVSADNPISKKIMVDCRDLEGFPIALLNAGSFHYMEITKMFESAGVKPNVVLQSSELSTITNLIQEENFGTFTYKEIYNRNPKIVAIPCKEKISAPINLVWSCDNYLTKSSEMVRDYLLSREWL